MNSLILIGAVVIYLVFWAVVLRSKSFKDKIYTPNTRIAGIVISSIAFGYFLSQTIMNPNRNLILLTILFAIGIMYNVFKYWKLVQN